MSIHIKSNKEAVIVIGEGDIGITGVVSPEDKTVGVIINQFKNRIEVTDERISPNDLADRFDENAPTATLLFIDKIALQNTINVLEEIKNKF